MYRKASPVLGPEAFEERGKDAELSQAAFVLASSAGVGGYAEAIPASDDFPLPELPKLHRRRRMRQDHAMAYVDADHQEMVENPDLRISARDAAPLARGLMDKPDAQLAGSLVEMSMHNPSRVVRTAAAAAALDTTGLREDVRDILVDSAGHRDELIRDIARTALARVEPQHPKLQRLRGKQAELHGHLQRSNTAVITHGTFASRTRWWKPGGDFYEYADSINPSLHLHHTSYKWTGRYSHAERDEDAALLVDWITDQGLDTPDFLAHSHGGTVAHLATQKGARFDRLILMSWPVHAEWFPQLSNVERIIDVRVHYDLVIMADRGGQHFNVTGPGAHKITSHINGWFSHGATHDPDYWMEHGLAAEL